MLRITSRVLMTTLVVFGMLGMSDSAEAQTSKSKLKRSASRATSSATARSTSRARVRSSFRTRGANTRSLARTLKSVRPGDRSRILRVDPAPRDRTVRVRPPTRTAYSRRSSMSGLKSRSADVDREAYQNLFRRRPVRDRDVDRERPRQRPRSRDFYRRGHRDGFHSGFHRGYSHGYHRGYHRGFRHGHYYRHRHYYGPHVVFGWHYGGFGYHSGRWHFAIVIGGPAVVYHRHHHYHYTWWDSRPASLVTWDRVREAHPADYSFYDGACVALWVRTTEGADYEIKIDPRVYDARDPGDLYATLWSELEREGQLQLVDVNGAVHVFPAALIQQIEATGCR